MNYIVEVTQVDKDGKRVKTIDYAFAEEWEKAIDEATELFFVNFKSDLPEDLTEPVTPKTNYKNLLIEIMEVRPKTEIVKHNELLTTIERDWEIEKIYTFFKA